MQYGIDGVFFLQKFSEDSPYSLLLARSVYLPGRTFKERGAAEKKQDTMHHHLWEL